MDTFTFMVALLLMMLAVKFNENWLAFAVIAILILTMRSASTTILLVIAMVVLYTMRGSLEPYWPFVFFGLVVFALLMGMGSRPQQPEYYSPDMYSGLMGGGQY
jgi:hypothetical protein